MRALQEYKAIWAQNVRHVRHQLVGVHSFKILSLQSAFSIIDSVRPSKCFLLNVGVL